LQEGLRPPCDPSYGPGLINARVEPIVDPLPRGSRRAFDTVDCRSGHTAVLTQNIEDSFSAAAVFVCRSSSAV